MGKLAVHALRAVLAVVLTGTVLIQAGMVWALASGSDPENGTAPLTPLRVITILGMASADARSERCASIARRCVPRSSTPPSVRSIGWDPN